MPKPEPRFVDAVLTPAPAAEEDSAPVVAEAPAPEPVVAPVAVAKIEAEPKPTPGKPASPVDLQNLVAKAAPSPATPLTPTPEIAALTEEANPFIAADIDKRADSAQISGLAQDPAIALANVTSPVRAQVLKSIKPKPRASAASAPVQAPVAEEPVIEVTKAEANPLLALQSAVNLAADPATGADETEDTQAMVTAKVVRAVNSGQTDEEIAAIIDSALTMGQITAPAAVFQTGGGVDTRSLLITLVEQAVDGGSTEAETAATRLVSANAAPIAARPTGRPTYYVVQMGDSLASISYRYYGSTEDYVKIFQANTGTIQNPSQIYVGQRLRIPG
ncbi:LysM peptidoglycan-binding domain-containing protein [Alphaproteobacteria bacterium KMM 3653]|uniref:LysM peptidoglycan-binding domain-containing protein n=1 Tax=Harenicola maris TaxID=2841044 RepID=A0AAP2CPQ8_9RHOB|nr:LysM peptidoglycan-binding domain-containing protein [Harenicola maris]